MKTKTTCLIVAGLFFVGPAFRAQEFTKQPSSEIKKFEMYVGKWRLQTADEATPFGPAGKGTSETEIRFVHSGFSVEEHGVGTFVEEAGGTQREPINYSYTIVYNHDPAVNAVRSLFYDCFGAVGHGEGSIEGSSWKNQWTQLANGKNYKCRGVSVVAPDRKSWTYEWTYSEDGLAWKPYSRGTATRAGDVERTPGPEIRKFEILIGKWKMEERDEDSPFGPAGHGSYETEIRFVQNGFAVEERGQGTFRPDHGASNHYTYGFNYFHDPSVNRMKTLFYDSAGYGGVGEGAFDGRTWRCHWTQEANGKNYHCRNVTTVAPDGKSFDYEYSYSEDGATWKVCFKGTATKTGEIAKTPGPEHKKMEIAAGKWEFEGVDVESPLGPGGKWRGTVESRMILGGFCLENRGWGTSSDGESHSLEIISYDPEKSVYRSTWFDSRGQFDKAGENATATIEGNTWNFSWKQEKNGRKYDLRQKVAFAPDGKTSTWETSYSEDGSTWKKFSEAKVRKVGELAEGRRQSAKDAIAASNREFERAVVRGDSAKVAAQYTQDAKMFVDRQPICAGNKAIGDSYKELSATLEGAKARCQSTEVVEAGDWAYETGTFVVTGKDGAVLMDNKYLCIWKLEDGTWRVHRDMSNANPLSEEQSAKNGIDRWHRTYDELWQQGDAAAVARLYTEDAEIHWLGKDTFRGRESIRKLVTEDIDRVRSGAINVGLTNITVAQNGDTAYNIVKVLEKAPDGKVVDELVAVGFWKREAGEWKLHRDAWISTLPADGTAANVAALPKSPGPEHKQLQVWVGDWAYEGESKESPFGPAGKMKGTESAKMILDGFFFEDRWDDQPLDGVAARGLTYLRYDPATKTYVDYSFANDGTFGSTTNTVNGNVWTGLGTQTDATGKVYKTRFLRILSADGKRGDLKAEYSADDGKSWMTWWEATNRKVSK